jgi:uncharacterized membrane protein YczE
MNTTHKSILKNTLLAAVGLFFFGFGVYLTIQANIGVAPWDAFNLGLSKTFGIKYGTASIGVSFIIVIIDIILGEQIGIGMVLDAILVGKTVDLFNYINLVPAQQKLVPSLIIMTAGLFIMGFSQYMYMKAALGCGPRDSILVGLSRRINKVSIGVISICILAVVTFIGWLLGGSIGIGTLICAFLVGPIMQLDFKLVRFNATEIKHQDIITSFRILLAGNK